MKEGDGEVDNGRMGDGCVGVVCIIVSVGARVRG